MGDLKGGRIYTGRTGREFVGGPDGARFEWSSSSSRYPPDAQSEAGFFAPDNATLEVTPLIELTTEQASWARGPQLTSSRSLIARIGEKRDAAQTMRVPPCTEGGPLRLVTQWPRRSTSSRASINQIKSRRFAKLARAGFAAFACFVDVQARTTIDRLARTLGKLTASAIRLCAVVPTNYAIRSYCRWRPPSQETDAIRPTVCIGRWRRASLSSARCVRTPL